MSVPVAMILGIVIGALLTLTVIFLYLRYAVDCCTPDSDFYEPSFDGDMWENDDERY